MNKKIQKVADELKMKVKGGFLRGGYTGICGMWCLDIDMPEFHNKGFESYDGAIEEENVCDVIEAMKDMYNFWEKY